MAWLHANDKTPYDGPTHILAGATYTGATRTSESRRLVFIAEAEVKTEKVRARTKSGHYVADDPATPENEAWVKKKPKKAAKVKKNGGK
jgi:hypothetical protein